MEAIGELVLAWGRLEHTTAQKLATMRQAFGDVRIVEAPRQNLKITTAHDLRVAALLLS